MSINSPALFWLLALVPVIGMSSAWVARATQGSARERLCQWLFLACLAAVGTVTLASFGLNPAASFLPGTTLSLMVLAAVWDFRCDPRTV
jgi:hypothetical protein